MIILGIETSCDDTAAALVLARGGRFYVRKELRQSQTNLHAIYGGVVPEVAARAHADVIMPLIEQTLTQNGAVQKPDIIAVTAGPGLITALQVGVNTAAGLAYAWNIPLVAVNHLAGHLYGNWLGDKPDSITFPALGLLVSGGHTELSLIQGHNNFKVLGKTRDDAAGEAFDKIGKLLGFSYPGGPAVAACAKAGDGSVFHLPRPMIDTKNHDFSFAGLKTAALYMLQKITNSYKTPYRLPAYQKADFCASVQEAIVETLVEKTMYAAREYRPSSLLLGGGVAANTELRKRLMAAAKKDGILLTIPPLSATVDNAAMVAVAGFFAYRQYGGTSPLTLNARPNWSLEEYPQEDATE